LLYLLPLAVAACSESGKTPTEFAKPQFDLDPTKTVLTAAFSVDAEMDRAIAYDWTLTETVVPLRDTVEIGESADFAYTLTATRTVRSDLANLRSNGSVCVTNAGGLPTDRLDVLAKLQNSTDGGTTWNDQRTVVVDVTGYPVLAPGESHCYPFTFQFQPNLATTQYRWVAVTSARNLDPSSGPNVSTIVENFLPAPRRPVPRRQQRGAEVERLGPRDRDVGAGGSVQRYVRPEAGRAQDGAHDVGQESRL
jgi:hypothetical protein